MRKLLFLLGALALSACGPQGEPSVSVRDAVFAPPIGVTGVAAGYFTLQNNGPADTLLTVSTPVATSVEMHETTMTDGMMRMTRLENVEIPAGGIVAFSHGGKHLMLFGVKPDIPLGSTATMTFTFAKAGAKDFTFTVKSAAAEH